MDSQSKNTEESLEKADDKPTLKESPGSQPESKAAGSDSDGLTAKKSLVEKIREASNLYLIVFLLLVTAAIVTAAVILSSNNQNQKKSNKSSSLTTSQLAQLSGNTTIVGDAKQTLDIQSNTIVEGQLLVRKDVDVAGALKVGGGLSLSAITVGGQGNFGQLQINGTLSVSGDTTFSGLLSVQKNLNVAGTGSFGGTLSANVLSATSLQLNGDLQINRHITLGGASPVKSNGPALGSGGTASINGSDTAGTITCNIGSSPTAGDLVAINFAAKFKLTPHVIVTPVGSPAAGLQYYVTRSTTGFTLNTLNAATAGSSFSFDYFVTD